MPWYVEYDRNRLEIGSELYDRLANNPENTFLTIAVEDDKIYAIIIAYVERDYVWGWQSGTKQGFRHSKTLFNSLLEWTKSKNVSKIKCLPNVEVRDLLRRRYGFCDDPDNPKEMIRYVR